jgi:hypothetical protein
MKKYLLALGLVLQSWALWSQITTTVTAPASPSNSTSLAFSVAFSQPVENFNSPASDLIIGGTATGTLVGGITGGGANYTVTITGMTGAGTVTLQIPAGAADETGSGTTPNEISNVGTVTFDNVAPTVTINQKSGQADPTNVSPVLFTVVFSEPIQPATFTTGDVVPAFGTVTSVNQVAPNNGTTFEVTVTATGSGTIQPTIAAGLVSDLAGNTSAASTSTDNSVLFDNTSPTVTVNQKSGQADPTSASPVVFTVVFNKPIQVSTFVNGDVTIAGTATGTSATVTQVTPNDGTTFEISVAATGGGTVIASLGAGVVSDPLGNLNAVSSSSDNSITFQTAPVLSSPTVTSIGSTDADMGGTVASDGGATLSARGTVWKTSAGVVAADNPLAEGGTGTGVFSHNRTSLPAGTQIFFRAYATNATGTGLSPEASFFTFSSVPGSQDPNFSATVNSATQVTLNFSSYTSVTDADGYVILRRIGSNPVITEVQDGVAPLSLNTGLSTRIAIITTTATNYVDSGLTPGTTYNYALVPFNWNLSNPETYQYLQGGGPDFGSNYRAQGITFFNASDIALNGGTTNDIDYAANQTASGLTNGNSVSLGTFRIRDGGTLLPGNDGDNVGTTLTSVTFSIANHTNVRTIAIFDGGSNLAEAPVTSGSVTFGSLSLTANDNSNKDFSIRASFNASAADITDNQPITLTITNAVASPAGSGFTNATAGGATTGGGTNRIEVTATKAVFVPTTITTDVNVGFSIQARALDALNNLDLDQTSNVTLALSGGPGVLATSPPDPATKPFVAGVVSWSNLRINLAGAAYTLTGQVSLTDATAIITVNSLGVTITGPANQNFCFGGTFQALTNIVIAESDPGDFAIGTNVSYSIILPAGFEFNPAVTPTLSEVGNNITALGSTPTAYPAANIYRFQYTSSNVTAPLDQITIAGLQIRYTGSTAVSNQPILRIGGSAIVSGSPVDTPSSHGTLSAAAATPPPSFDFAVDELPGNPSVSSTTTNFTTDDLNVRLIGTPSGGVFSGNGVAFSATNGYVFSPSAAGTGDHSITYRYTSPSSPNCVNESTKNFRVSSTNVIQNLNTIYCLKDPISPLLSVSTARRDLDFPPIFGFTYSVLDFQIAYGTTVFELRGVSPFLFFVAVRSYGSYSNITQFNPDNADENSTLVSGAYNVKIRYRVLRNDGFVFESPDQVVTIYPLPNVSFTMSKTSFCEGDAPVALIGTPTPSTTISNDFFAISTSAAVANAGGNTWTFDPNLLTIPAMSASTSAQITYTFRDENTQCSNTSAPTTVTLNRVPPELADSDFVTGSGPNLSTCQNGTAGSFSVNSQVGFTYSWYNNPGLSGTPVTGVTFTPAVNTATAGVTNFYVTQTRAGCQSPSKTVSLTVDQAPVAVAGLDQSLCSGSNLTLSSLGASVSGAATPAGSFWTVFGGTTGRFLNAGGNDVTTAGNGPFNTAATYEPSSTDLTNGFIRLRLFTNDPVGPCVAVFDEVRITINSVAQVNAGADVTVCAGQPISLSATIGGAASSVTWTDKPPADPIRGTFSNPNGTVVTYTPSATDLANGAVIPITITTNDPDGPCVAATDNLQLTINRAPTVTAGLDRFLCQGNTITLNATGAAIGGSATSATWSLSSGITGSIVGNGPGNSFQSTSFTPVGFGQSRLVLTTDDPDGAGPCTAVSSDVIITTNQAAIVNAGIDNVFCSGQTIALSGSTSGSASAVTWSRVTGSGGSFVNGNAPITTYTPTTPELVNGATITFRLTTNDPDGTDPITGPCLPAQDDVDITINQRPEVNAGADQTLCADEPVNLAATLIGSATSGTWSGGGGTFASASSITSGYSFSTSEQAGDLSITLSFTTNDSDGAGPCVPGTDQVVINVKPVPGSPTITDPGEYCVGDVILPLEAVGAPNSTIRWYRDAAITNLAGTGNSFATGVPNTIASQTTFYATQTVNGCESNVPAALEDIIINPLPVTQFTESDFCLDPAGNGVDFVSTSTIPAGSVVKWGWSFGDLDRLDRETGNIPAGTHQGATTGTFERPSHRYRTFGDYSVVLTTESDKGCISSTSKTITIEPIPDPNFQFRDVCATDNTRFDYIGTFASFIGGAGGYAWDFGDGGATSTAAQPSHRFTGSGNYTVRLTVSTNLGCTDSRTKTVSVLPLVAVLNGTPYTQSFETNNHGWFSEGFTPRTPLVPDQYFNTWQVAVASFPEINAASDGTRIWITRDNSLGTYRNDERSVLNTPCFVINNNRPVLSFDYWNSTDDRRDGAYLEISTDNGASWSRLGAQEQGLNWYNTDAITGLAQVNGKEQSGPIGQSVGQIGWSGKTGSWKNARFAIDPFGGSRIRLRYVFGSNSDQPGQGIYDGFALDNFSIDSRNRLVLVENFTNAAATGATLNNANFRTFQQSAANEIVKVQYHTSFPGNDPINAQNSMDLNARAAFYGVTAAPRGYIDGVSNAPFTFATPLWANNTYNTQSLSTAPIGVVVTPSRDGNLLNVNVSVTAVKRAIPGNQYILFVGVLEGSVGGENFVLRKFLPSAAGTPLPALTVGGTAFTSTFSWPIDSRNFAASTPAALNLSVVAFVQAAQPDPLTQVREVLQAAINTTPVPTFDSFTTGLEALTGDAIATYPNPAKEVLTVQLPFEARERIGVTLVDQLGKRVQIGELTPGNQQTILPVAGLAAGVYILQVGSGPHAVRKKVVIAQ